ncbi:MAG TPA: glutamate formimidoyltransferase [Clostridia bacterium]|nr:glutamate formimidoyltransferase [Clostridia bacterium]
MDKIVECIPNFSEGRDSNIIKEIEEAIINTKNVILLEHSSDYDHNRSVFTFMGSMEGVYDAMYKAASVAVNRIDLTRHEGKHPRIGAVDVIPLVPVQNVTMEECVELSKTLAERIYNELGLPVYLYENSASKPHRTNLADIRRGEFEGLVEKMQSEDWKPDYGTKPHPTAGAVVIGARKPLIAFNMQLNTANIEIATEIAKKIREKNGGLKCVKALGIMLETKNTAQVSVNLTDYTVTSLFEVFDTVCNEASKMGYEVVSSELIGLSPARAFIDTAARYLKLENYSYKKIIESHLLNLEI